MKIEDLKLQIEQLRELTSRWSEGEPISSVEMDMALDRVKSIYEMLRFEGNVSSVEVAAEAVVDVVEEVVDRIAESAIEVVEQIEADPAEEVIEEAVEQMVDDEALSKRERYNRIKSLYADDQPETVTPVEETLAPEPVCAAAPEPVVVSGRTPMVELLTLNDKFLLANDLFGGDMEALGATLAALDRQASFDDAIIYIAENYSWRSASDGAQIMYALLKRRFDVK